MKKSDQSQEKRSQGKFESTNLYITDGKVPTRPPDTTSELAEKIEKEKKKKQSK